MAVLLVAALVAAWPGAAPAAAGPIVADSGFRPNPDGFSFANYGPGYAELDAGEVERMFGPGVCVKRRAGKCVLGPVARAWAKQQNKGLEGGHCYGFAVLSELIDKGQLGRFGYSSLAAFGGGPETFDLGIENNTRLQRSLARGWAFQTLDSVSSRTVDGKPSRVLNVLIDQLRADEPESWTMGIFQRGFKGGHAITPYAVEDMGAGVYDVHVYDNNWPDDADRRLTIDTGAETWSYYAAVNPGEPDALYEGDATSNTMQLMPTRPALGVQDCPICVGRAGLGSKYNQLTLDSGGAEHASLLLRDSQGRRTGTVGDQFVNEIPGVQVIPRSSGGPQFGADGELEDYADSLEPIFKVPKRVDFRLRVDGRLLTEADRQSLTVVGPSFDATVQSLRVSPGEVAALRLAPKRDRLVYSPTASSGKAAVAFGAQSKQAAFRIAISALRLPAKKSVSYRKLERHGLLRIGDNAPGRQMFKVQLQAVGAGGQAELGRRFALRGARSAYLDYGALAGKGRPKVVVTHGNGKVLRKLPLRVVG